MLHALSAPARRGTPLSGACGLRVPAARQGSHGRLLQRPGARSDALAEGGKAAETEHQIRQQACARQRARVRDRQRTEIAVELRARAVAAPCTTEQCEIGGRRVTGADELRIVVAGEIEADAAEIPSATDE